MYEETLKRKPLRGFGTFLSIIILVFGILTLMLLVGWVQILWNVGYLQYILLAAVIVFLLWLLRRQVTRYVYAIGDGRVDICRQIGESKKRLFVCGVSEIQRFGNKSEAGSFSGKKKHTFLFEYSDADAFFIVLEKDVLILGPTGQFVQILKESYEKTHC